MSRIEEIKTRCKEGHLIPRTDVEFLLYATDKAYAAISESEESLYREHAKKCYWRNRAINAEKEMEVKNDKR